MNKNTNVYFVSDFHLGIPDYRMSRERELKIVRWLDEIQHDASEIYFLGDVFDFWFEYKTVVPKGYIRLLGKLAALSDKGIIINYFTGNHDMWIFDYLPSEIKITIYREPLALKISGKSFLIGHGDGLGPGDRGYKFIKKVFANPLCQWLFRQLHPDVGIRMAAYWSRKSRINNNDEKFLGENNEWLAVYAKRMLEKQHFDYFVFGHRHLPLDIQLSPQSRYINLGEWVHYCTYAVFDGDDLVLKKFSL